MNLSIVDYIKSCFIFLKKRTFFDRLLCLLISFVFSLSFLSEFCRFLFGKYDYLILSLHNYFATVSLILSLLCIFNVCCNKISIVFLPKKIINFAFYVFAVSTILYELFSFCNEQSLLDKIIDAYLFGSFLVILCHFIDTLDFDQHQHE